MLARNEADDEGDTFERKETTTVSLGSNEYLMTVFALGTDFNQFYYVRKVDDDLFCVILISDLNGNPPEYYESLFE